MERLQTRRGRLLAHLEAWFVDHEILRKLYRNFYRISEGAYRSNHPSPGFIRRLQQKHGLKTIISLRKANKSGQYRLEKEACEKLGIELINSPMSSRSLPRPEKIHRLKKYFETAEKPLLLHCKSGADRAGLASVLYLHLVENQPIREALRHLSWRYGHFRYADTGKLDFFFDHFLAFEKEHPEVSFMDWVDHHYDRDAIGQQFKASGWANILVNRILRRE